MKTLEDKARRLADDLHAVLEEASNADKRKAAAREELSWQELRALRAVGRGACCPMRKLADSICLSLSSATGIIDRLVEKRLVRRDRAADDRRVVEVALTEAGRAVNAEAMEGHVEFARGLLTQLDEREQEALITLFHKLAAGLEEKGAA